MYEQHFGLKDKPFNLAPDPDYLYVSNGHGIALSMLEYGLAETAAGLIVITGDIGTGKTTLIRKLLRGVDYNQLTVGMINNTTCHTDELMSLVSSAFNLPYENKDHITQFREFQQFLIAEYAQRKRTALIVDEAQNLDSRALEELRMLTNINADRDQLIQIILIGQPELKELLQQPKMAQIAQRVAVEYHLEPLTLDEVTAYIRHRIEVAGSEENLFNEEAIKAIYYVSGGVPRLVNTLCDYSLVYAYACGATEIDLDTTLQVIRGRKIGGINRFIKKRQETELVRADLLENHGIDLAVMCKL